METTAQFKSIDDEVSVTSVVEASTIKTYREDGQIDIAYVESKVVERELYPKSNCKRCFGRGVIGFDRITNTMVICECIKKIYRNTYESQYRGVKPEETGLILMIDGERFRVDNNGLIVKVGYALTDVA